MTGRYEKLIIGTAQWGLDYGISNKHGKTGTDEITNILNTANKYGINALDTASAYGDAEKVIGKLATDNSRIITKIGIGNHDIGSRQSKDDIRNKVKQSYADLGGKTLEGVLIHDPTNLEGCNNTWCWDTLEEMREEGYMKKIGISVYNPTQAEALAKIYKPNIIQIPFNAFDKKAANSGTLKRLKDEGIEIHARSIFLQGLLLMNIKDISEYFSPWILEIKRWHEYCITNRLSLLEGAIANAMGEVDIDKFIVGIENTKQLEQIVAATKKTGSINFQRYTSESDEGLINPTKWKVS